MRFSVSARLAAALVLLGSGIARASCIVASMGQGEIAIAADSLVLQRSHRLHECKIHHEGAFYFATAGLLSKRETRFRLEPLARSACATARGIDEAARLFAESARAPLTRAMAYSRRHSPAVYRRDYRGRQSIVAVIFAAFERGRSRLAMVSFGLDRSGRLVETSDTLPNQSGSNVLQAGDIDAIHGYEQAHPEWALGMTPTQLTRYLIDLEVKMNRAQVAGPISLLKITPAGADFVEPGACAGKR